MCPKTNHSKHKPSIQKNNDLHSLDFLERLFDSLRSLAWNHYEITMKSLQKLNLLDEQWLKCNFGIEIVIIGSSHELTILWSKNNFKVIWTHLCKIISFIWLPMLTSLGWWTTWMHIFWEWNSTFVVPQTILF